MPHVGHMTNMEDPARFNAIVLESDFSDPRVRLVFMRLSRRHPVKVL